MSADDGNRLERRVARAAEEALEERKVVTPVDVLMGWAGFTRFTWLYGGSAGSRPS